MDDIDHFENRLRRAESWMARAEKETGDPDVGFILYWISFNAAYSRSKHEVEFSRSERERFKNFFKKIIAHDQNNEIYNLVWTRFTQEIKGLLDNKYIFEPFWRCEDPINDRKWEESFLTSKAIVNRSLSRKNTVIILDILFDRLYVLRNQLIHGSATWAGGRNRRQVKDGYELLSKIHPIIIKIMRTNPNEDWGIIPYRIFDEEF